MTSLTFARVFSMFVYIRAHFRSMPIGRNLTAQSTGSHKGIGSGIQISETQLQALLPSPAAPPECPGEFARRLEAIPRTDIPFLSQFCAECIILSAFSRAYTKCSCKVLKKTSNKFHRQAPTIIIFSVIFAGRALKLEKVSTFTIHVDRYHPLQQTKKQFQCLNKPLFLEFS